MTKACATACWGLCVPWNRMIRVASEKLHDAYSGGKAFSYVLPWERLSGCLVGWLCRKSARPRQQRPCVHVVDHVGGMHPMHAHGRLQRRYRSLTTLDGLYEGGRRVTGRRLTMCSRADSTILGWFGTSGLWATGIHG